VVVLVGFFAFILFVSLPLTAVSGQQASTSTLSPTNSHTRWPTNTRTPSHTRWSTSTRRPTDTRWPTQTRWPTLTVRSTDTRWPTQTRRPSDTRWPTITRRPTATRWPSPTLQPTKTRWPTITRGPTSTPLPTATPTFTATSTPTPTPLQPEGWLRYYNGLYDFEFYHPGDANIVEQDDSHTVMYFSIAPGTNLVSKYLEFYISNPSQGCSGAFGGTDAGAEIINGYRFQIQTGMDQGAGQIHEWTSYSSVQGSACFSFNFVLHSGNIGAFPTGTPEFNKAAESALFQTLVGTFRLLAPTPTPSGLTLGPFGVVLVASNDALQIRSGPGVTYASVGSFFYNAADVMRTGPTQLSGADTWYQVQNPMGGTGWSNSYYLTERVSSASFCGDARNQSLFVQLQQAANGSSGSQLAGLVSPVRGLYVQYWHSASAIHYTPSQASGVFASATQQNWGSGPSGMDTIGTFAAIIQPELQAVLNAAHESSCNDPRSASMFSEPWPAPYTNFNFYSLFKPGTPGIDLDYKQWMVGIDYVLGQPYIVSLIRIIWEP
jgi:hypothetical protein